MLETIGWTAPIPAQRGGGSSGLKASACEAAPPTSSVEANVSRNESQQTVFLKADLKPQRPNVVGSTPSKYEEDTDTSREPVLPPEEVVSKLTADDWERTTLVGAWNYYKKENEKSPAYRMLKTRAKRGLDRLRDCVDVCQGDKDKAKWLLAKAILGLAYNPFLAGDNDKNKKYQDWISHLCKDWETFEKRLEDYEEYR